MFLVPLVLGFVFNSLSAFTTWLCRHFGERHGRRATFILRNVLGIPMWTVGLALAVRTPSAQVFVASRTTELLGWFLLGAGCVVIVLALGALRGRAALPSTHDSLIRHGPYAYVRHPIHGGMLLALVALVLLRPTQATVLGAGIGVVWVIVQSQPGARLAAAAAVLPNLHAAGSPVPAADAQACGVKGEGQPVLLPNELRIFVARSRDKILG